MTELKLITTINKFDIVAVTETHPKCIHLPIRNSRFNIPGYKQYSNIKKEGRGVITYIKEQLTSCMIKVPD